MEDQMLEESTQRKEARKEQNPPAAAKVTCFVCKREVEREQAKRILHSKNNHVWVCEAHIK
jgi:hypothetical protein